MHVNVTVAREVDAADVLVDTRNNQDDTLYSPCRVACATVTLSFVDKLIAFVFNTAG